MASGKGIGLNPNPHVSVIKESLGLSNSIQDKDIWLHFIRVSKDWYDKFETRGLYYGKLDPAQRDKARDALAKVCSDRGLFSGKDLGFVVDWRVRQLHKYSPKQKQESAPQSSKDAGAIPYDPVHGDGDGDGDAM